MTVEDIQAKLAEDLDRFTLTDVIRADTQDFEMSLPPLHFSGLRGEDATEYLETIDVYTDQATSTAKTLRMKVTFRSGLIGKAETWYKGLSKDIRSD